jgi:two-component system OmpR family sensor kinase
MIRTLYGKTAAILLALFLAIGLLYVIQALLTTRLYFQEGAQRLNLNLAEYLVSEKFFLKEGRVNEQALKESFHMLMEINPNIELYILGPGGDIIAYSAPPGKVKRKRVSLGPLKRFLSKGENLPVLGDDPRDPGRKKVFSAAPIPPEGPVKGYLYIILGGEEYDSVAGMLRSSYILRLSMWGAVAALLFVFLAGLFLFHLLTRRVRSLAAAMKAFEQSDLSEPVTYEHPPDPATDDEIDRLGTAFSEMSRRIISQINEIRAADRLRREFVSNISHDLRTPLTSLHGYLETLLIKGNEISPEEKGKYLKTALRNAEHLGQLVSGLFELANLDSRETEVKSEPFHPGELLQDIVHKFHLSAEKKGIELKVAFPDGLPLVLADIGLVERAVENLTDNALRYTQEGGTVTLSLSPEDGEVRVSVSDSGKGISEEDLPHIFDRHYRAEKEVPGGSESAGLGLAITKRILELHGRGIAVRSEVGRGTTFTFRLPVYHPGK